MRNEKTGAAAARLAGYLLAILADEDAGEFLTLRGQLIVSVGSVRKIAASLLTQAPDRKPAVKSPKARVVAAKKAKATPRKVGLGVRGKR